jgi:hypothetical protein
MEGDREMERERERRHGTIYTSSCHKPRVV